MSEPNQNIPRPDAHGALKEPRVETGVVGMGLAQIEDTIPRYKHTVEQHHGVHLVPVRTERMVRGVGRRHGFAADELDALGVHRHSEVYDLIGP